VLNADTRRIELPGGSVALTPTQFKLVEPLFARPGRLVSYTALEDHLYAGQAAGGPDDARSAVKVQICLIRRKLKTVGARNLIVTVFGLGYRLDLDQAQADFGKIPAAQKIQK
jgi:two-component system OmpR family response regulator